MNKPVAPSQLESSKPSSGQQSGAASRAETQREPIADPKAKTKPAGRETDGKPAADPAAHTSPEHNPLKGAYWTRKRVGITAIAVVAILGGIFWLFSGPTEPKVTYLTVPVARGTVTLSVSAKGTIAVVDQTDVRAATDGVVASVAVQSGDHVRAGQVLARLTDGDARAALSRAQDDIAYNQADLKQSQAGEAQASAEATRAGFLKAHNAAPLGEYEETQADLNRADADVSQARALIQTAQGRAQSARAEIAARDVRSPIDGIVLKRNVQPGDAARLHGDPLFTLAGELSRLRLDAAFPEAQLGVLHVGQAADFTVPAYPRRVFSGTLASLDLLPQDGQPQSDDPAVPKDRVMYKGVMDVDNANGLLRPGMTATITLITAQAKDVMVVPNTALSFVPPNKAAAQLPPLKQTPGQPRRARLWVSEGPGLRPREVVLGLSDGRQTQIAQGDLKFGEKVVTGSVMAADNKD